MLSVPPKLPRSAMPPPLVQRKAWLTTFPARRLNPTTTLPSAETPLALLKVPPRVPRSAMPPPLVQRKARMEVSPLRRLSVPTTTLPSAETAAAIEELPVPRKPRPWNAPLACASAPPEKARAMAAASAPRCSDARTAQGREGRDGFGLADAFGDR